MFSVLLKDTQTCGRNLTGDHCHPVILLARNGHRVLASAELRFAFLKSTENIWTRLFVRLKVCEPRDSSPASRKLSPSTQEILPAGSSFQHQGGTSGSSSLSRDLTAEESKL